MAIYDCTPDGGNGGGITLQSIVITTPPNTTTYTAGQVFDNTGMVVTAYYDFGLSEEITGYTVSPSGALTGDITEITISYSDGGVIRSATYPITVTRNTATLTIDPTTISLDADTQTATAQVSYNGDGELSIVNSNPEIVSANLSGTILTVNSLVDTSQTVTVTINAPETGYYTAASAVLTVNNYVTVQVYGAEWDGTATTKWSRTDGAELFPDPQPAVNNGTGSSPFDNIMPWAGMTRVSDPVAGEMVQIPKYWYKWTRSGASMQLQIANEQTEGFYVSPAHADRGDGAGERDVVYVGRYHCGSNYKSQTATTPNVNITRSAARSSIKNLGSGVYQWDWAMNWTIKMLYLVEFANWNSQTKIGYGCGNNSAPQNMGYTDDMSYHTGTTQSSRTTYGLGTQYRYIEGLWDNVYDWVDGCYYNSNGLNIILNPDSFSDTSGGTVVGVPSGDFPSELSVSEELNNQWVYPTTASGSNSTYVPDYWLFYASFPCLYVGGNYNQNTNHGLFYVNCGSASSSSSSIGSRLMKLP